MKLSKQTCECGESKAPGNVEGKVPGKQFVGWKFLNSGVTKCRSRLRHFALRFLNHT